MEIQDFFEVGSKLVMTTLQAHLVDERKNVDYEVANDNIRLLRGDYDSISFPVKFKQRYGKELRDLLDTGWAGFYLISNRMMSAFEENKLTGWKAFPVLLLDKKEHEIPGYHGLSITGRCGPIDILKSKQFKKRFVPDGPYQVYYKGLYVGLEKWDGSDFFLPKKYNGTVVTKNAANIIKTLKFTNIVMTNLADIEFDQLTANVIRTKKQE